MKRSIIQIFGPGIETYQVHVPSLFTGTNVNGSLVFESNHVCEPYSRRSLFSDVKFLGEGDEGFVRVADLRETTIDIDGESVRFVAIQNRGGGEFLILEARAVTIRGVRVASAPDVTFMVPRILIERAQAQVST